MGEPVSDDRTRDGDGAEGIDESATSELERLRATATSLSELSLGLNEMVETLARIMARDDIHLED